MSGTYIRTSSADGEQYLGIRTADDFLQYWWNSSDEPVEPQIVPNHFTPLGFIDETEGKQWPPWAGGPGVECHLAPSWAAAIFTDDEPRRFMP